MAVHVNTWRLWALPIAAGLAVAYVRNALQYHRYSWDSLTEFLVTWFVHYVAVLLVIGVAHALTRGKIILVGERESLKQLTMEDAVIFGSLLAVVAAVAVFVIAHWIPTELND